jgi:thiopeptide-type bacteriocin biosynthesis protein
VALSEGDNEWVLDLENGVAVEAALAALRHGHEAVLVELFPPPSELCASGPAGRFIHELVLPLVATPRTATGLATSGSPAQLRPAQRARGRRFPPGSEWLYAKLYAGSGTTDSVLRDVVGPVVRAVTASGAADRWFFIRYADPDHHLRVRFHGQPSRLRAEVEPALHDAVAPWLADGGVWRVMHDTYERELDRYGGPAGVELCEAAFAADSDAVLAIVELLAGDAGMDARWRLCLVGIDRLLDDFGFDLQERRDWARSRRDAYFAEFEGTPELARQLGRRWRSEGRGLLSRTRSTSKTDPLAPGLRVLAGRSHALGPTAARLRERAAAGELSVSVGELVASLAHMHANRLLRSAVRPQELVLYDLLDRLYRGRLSRPPEP